MTDKHTTKDEEIRHALRNIVDCICLSSTSTEAKNCIERSCIFFADMIDYLTQRDAYLKRIMKKLSLSNAKLARIQLYLLRAMLDVCHETISEEIQQSNYLSLIVEDASGVCETPYFSVILRYMKEGKSVERFWAFTNRQQRDLSNYIVSIMQYLKVNETPEKLIAQAYDGSPQLAVIVQELVKASYPNAHYIHSHSFDLDLVMKRALSDIREIRIFFANLKGMCKFFAMHRMHEKYPSIQFPDEDTSLSQSIRIICDNRSAILDSLDTVLIEECVYPILKNSCFEFWLSFFRKVVPFVDMLSDEIKKMENGIDGVKESLKKFEKNIRDISNSISAYTEGESLLENTPTKRKKEGNEKRIKKAKVACDLLISESKLRFESTIHIIAQQLFNGDKYTEYNRFREDILNIVCDFYDFLDANRLRKELESIYSRSDGKRLSLREQNLTGMTEITKLLDVVKTVPTLSPEEGASILGRVRRFPMKTPDRHFELLSLAMTMIGCDFIKEISEFQDKVVNKFIEDRNSNFFFSDVDETCDET